LGGVHLGDYILAAGAQIAVLGHFGQVPPAAAAFVVGCAGDPDINRQDIVIERELKSAYR
jgi:hypothetical protein